MPVSAIAGRFAAHFVDPAYVWPGGTTITVERFSFVDRGGCDTATLTVKGDAEQLTQLFALLGLEVRIYNPSGDLVWWGLIHDVDLGFGIVGAGASLDRMANRVKVTYTERDAFGVSESKATEWSGSPSSQSRYGTKERIESIGDGNAAMATARSAQMLARLAWPRPRRTAGGRRAEGGVTATVNLRGLWHFQAWQHYENRVGRIENAGGGGSLALAIGAKYSGTRLGLVRRNVGDVDGALGWVLEGDRLTLSGSGAGNNKTYSVNAAAKMDVPRVYTSDLIEFEPENDVKDQSSEFDWVATGQFIEISGSPANSGIWYVRDREGGGHFEVANALTRDIANEAFGPTITIRWGSTIQVVESTWDEMPGPTLTLQSWNEQLAQRFIAPAGMVLKQLAVSVGKHGAPGDNLLVEICADDGLGLTPGAVLSTVTISPASLPDDEVREQWFSCNQAVSAGAVYWLRFRRSGAATHASWYYVAAIEQAYPGSTRGWNGTNWNHLNDWRPSTPTYSIVFRLHDAEDTSASVARIVAQCGQGFVTGVTMAATSVEHNQWADGDATGLAELERLLDIGYSTGTRLVAGVNVLRKLVVEQETTQPDADFDLPVLGMDEQLYTFNGTRWTAGVNPVGQWVRLAGVPRMAGLSYRLSPDYIRAAEYDVEAARWRIALRDDETEVQGL